MAAAGFDHDGGEGADGDAFAVEFEFAGAFEDDVDFGHRFVVVGLGVGFDVDLVDAGDGVLGGEEAAAGGAARAGLGGQFV